MNIQDGITDEELIEFLEKSADAAGPGVATKLRRAARRIEELAGKNNLRNNQWQPIDTAPRDGTDILVTAPDAICGCTLAYYEKDGLLRSTFNGEKFLTCFSIGTHWMPLPKPQKGF